MVSVRAFVLCSDVVEHPSGTIDIVGMMGSVNAYSFPLTVTEMLFCFFSDVRSKSRLSLRLVDGSVLEVIQEHPVNTPMAGPGGGALLRIPIAFKISKPGKYVFQLLDDDEIAAQYDFDAILHQRSS